MQRDAHCALRHSQLHRGFASRVSFQRYGTHDAALALAQVAQESVEVVHVLLVICSIVCQRLEQIVDGNMGPLAAPSKTVDELVARDGRDPGSDRRARHPGTAFQVQSEEDFLHNVFCIESEALRSRPHDVAQCNGQQHEQLAIRARVTLKRSLHQYEPLSFSL